MSSMQPSIPISILLSKEIQNAVLGQVIQDMQLHCFNEGAYVLETLSFDRIKELVGKKVVQANSNIIHVEGGLTAEFGYDNGGIRVYDRKKEPSTLKKTPKTGGYTVTFVFEDICLMVVLSSWTCRFKIYDDYQLVPRYPLDITDPTDFTFTRFKEWLDSRGNIAIIDACATYKGAFDVYISFMNYILWMCGIHPKSKLKKLSENDIQCLYENVVKMVRDFKDGTLISEYVDINGNKICGNNVSLSLMTGKNYQKPCPKCGSPIESVKGSGTKHYFCPCCQVLKK